MPSLSGLGKRPQGILRNKSILHGFKSTFQNCFWNVFITAGWSQICKIRNVWKLPSPFSRKILIPCVEKTSLSLKTSFRKKNCPINSKTVGQVSTLFYMNWQRVLQNASNFIIWYLNQYYWTHIFYFCPKKFCVDLWRFNFFVPNRGFTLENPNWPIFYVFVARFLRS
jgi:hypothetical protein